MPCRFLIVDDHPLFRAALGATLIEAGLAASITEAASADEMFTTLKMDREWDVILLDLNVPGANGLTGLLLLRAEFPEVPVMVISAVTDPGVIGRVLELGASGYLEKSAKPHEIRQAIGMVLEGGVPIPADLHARTDASDSDLMHRLSTLTPQQIRVLLMLGEGLMNKQIAHELSVAEATVKAHVSAILLKLDVDNRTQAVIAAARISQGGVGNVLSNSWT